MVQQPVSRVVVGLLLLVGLGCEGALAVELPSSSGNPPVPPGQSDNGGVLPVPPGDGGDRLPLAPDQPPPQCVPSCEGLQCGTDGCGGSCGTCAENEVCDEGGQCVYSSPYCPPNGNEGTRQGDVASDLQMELLGGGSTSIRELCGHKTVLVYYFAEWCGYCRQWMSDGPGRLTRDLADDDFQLVIYYAENNSYDTPDESDGERIRDRYDLQDIPVVMGNERAFENAFGNAGPQVKLLMEEGNIIAAPVAPMGDDTIMSVARR